MKNELKHLAEFREILENYRLSEELINDLNKNKLILLSAPTSVGRNTIIRELVKTGDYYFIVSDTTRHPRMNDGVMEENGGPYWFKSEEEILDGLKKGKYFGPAIIHNQQVSGMHVDEINKAYNLNKTAVSEVEIQGIDSLTKIKPDIISIFVLPPSMEVWMSRLKGRGIMSNDELKRRLTSAVKEFDYAITSEKFIFLINDNITNSVIIIEDILKNEKADMKQQQIGIELASKLKEEVKNLFSTLD